MTRARLKLLIPALIGLAGLLLLLLLLFRMVRDERSDAVWAADRHQALVARFAKGELTGQLTKELARAQTAIVKTRANPLEPCAGCVFEEGGRQILPRLAAQGSKGETVQYWAEALAAGEDQGDSMWAQRIELQVGCKESAGVAALSSFRAGYALLPEQEIASALAFVADCELPATASAELLRGASAVPGRRNLEGLQQMLLRAAHMLSPKDADYCFRRIQEISKSLDIGTRKFTQRWQELETDPVSLPANLGSASIVRIAGIPYYVEAGGQERSALAIRLGDELAEVAATMRASNLIDDEDSLSSEIVAGGQSLSSLQIALHSPRAKRARDDIRSRYHIKLMLLGLCSLLILSLSIMAVLLQRRRMRILELKSHFIAGVSHELKTPLASMRVLAETLERRTQGMSVVRDYPERLLRDIDGMVFVVENILSFNRLTKGRMVPKRETMSLEELLTRAVDEVREHTDKEIELLVEDVSLAGDPELLSLLFRNLIANSVAYNRNQVVTISIETQSAPGGRLEITLRDNGVGVSEADKRELFDDFYRGKAKEMAPGSGLGLALCKRIVNLHKGDIRVGESSDAGTSFVMDLAKERS